MHVLVITIGEVDGVALSPAEEEADGDGENDSDDDSEGRCEGESEGVRVSEALTVNVGDREVFAGAFIEPLVKGQKPKSGMAHDEPEPLTQRP